MKKLLLFLVFLISIVSCQEPNFKKSPATKDDKIAIIEPDVDDGKGSKSGRTGLLLTNSYWHFYRGNNDGLWFNYSNNGLSWSASAKVNSGALLDQGPQAIFYTLNCVPCISSDYLIVVHRGRKSSPGSNFYPIYLTYTYDGINWYQSLVPATTSSTPALAVHNGKLIIFYASTPGGAIAQVNTTDLVNWSYSPVAINEGNDYLFGLSAAVDGSNKINLFYHFRDITGQIRMRSQASSDGINFGGLLNGVTKDYGTTSQDVDVVSYNGSIALVFQGASQSVRIIPDINNPTNIRTIPNAQTSMGPSITNYNGRLLVTYKGRSTNNLWFSYSDDGGVNWSNQTTHTGGTPSGPDVTAFGAN